MESGDDKLVKFSWNLLSRVPSFSASLERKSFGGGFSLRWFHAVAPGRATPRTVGVCQYKISCRLLSSSQAIQLNQSKPLCRFLLYWLKPRAGLACRIYLAARLSHKNPGLYGRGAFFPSLLPFIIPIWLMQAWPMEVGLPWLNIDAWYFWELEQFIHFSFYFYF